MSQLSNIPPLSLAFGGTPVVTDIVTAISEPKAGAKTVTFVSGNKVVIRKDDALEVDEHVYLRYKSLPYPFHNQPEVIGTIIRANGEEIQTL